LDLIRPTARRSGRGSLRTAPPKQASWLNPAEIEASLVSREGLGKDRIPNHAALMDRVESWTRAADKAGRCIHWRFTVHDARRVFRCSALAKRRSKKEVGNYEIDFQFQYRHRAALWE
jgi:hypothetical protein